MFHLHFNNTANLLILVIEWDGACLIDEILSPKSMTLTHHAFTIRHMTDRPHRAPIIIRRFFLTENFATWCSDLPIVVNVMIQIQISKDR